MNRNTDIWSSISSVLNGDPTDEEKQQVAQWITEDEKNKLYFDKLNDTKYNKLIDENAFRAKERIYLKTQVKVSQISLRKKLRLWKYIAVASVILLFIVGGVSLLKTESSTSILVESKSPTGSTTNLTLSDGTIVALNSNTSLSYPLSFAGDFRTVKLNGEAYFEVTQDTKHPFIVETNNMKIKVLGTQFNIKSYEDDNKTITTLLEGSVSIDLNESGFSSTKPIILMPGQQIILDKITNQTRISQVNADLYASWKDGQCFFENEKFIDIVKILERQFGVIINITSPSLENQLYSGFFTKKEGVMQILNSFSKYRNFDYKLTNTGIEIYEK